MNEAIFTLISLAGWMSSSAHLITDRNRQKWSSLKCYQWSATCYPHSLPKVYPFFGCFDPLGQLVIGFVIFYYLIENHCWLEWHMISQKYTNINHNRCNDFFRKKKTTDKCEKTTSHLSHSLDWCTMLQKKFHHFYPVLLAGNVQRCETIL